MSAATSATGTRLRTLRNDQRVRVIENEDGHTVNASGVVARVCRDGSAWIAMDRRGNANVHPFPEDASNGRGTHVKAYPDGCEGDVELGNRKERRANLAEAQKAAADADVPPPTLATFGKDHWSTFGYIETRIVDYKGQPAREHLRCIHGRHPMQAHQGGDASQCPTRLKGGVELHNHDDWDCLDDCEREGLLVNVGSGVNPCFQLTDLGRKIAAQLRAHKASGGSCSTFEVSP